MSLREYTVRVTFGNGDVQRGEFISESARDVHRCIVNHIHTKKDPRRIHGIKEILILKEVRRFKNMTLLLDPKMPSMTQPVIPMEPAAEDHNCRKRRTLDV